MATEAEIREELADTIGTASFPGADRFVQRIATRIAEAAAYTAEGVGAEPRSVQDKLHESVSLFDFVPSGQHAAILAGTSEYDAGPALRRMRDQAIVARRDAVLPPGRVFIASADPLASTYGLVINGVQGFRLRGAGKGTGGLFIAPGTDIGVINITNSADIELSDFDVDGNWQNQPTYQSWHGVRGAVLERVALKRLLIRHAAGYGVGFQVGGSPSRSEFLDIVFEDLHIIESAVDGIDIKNRGNSNRDIWLNRVAVVDPGRGDPLLPKAGLDLRGPCTVTAPTVIFTGADDGASHIGIRIRQSASSETNGTGGAKTIITGARVRALAPGNLILGINAGNPNAIVQGCIVEGCGARGFDGVAGGDDVQWLGNQAINCAVGMRLDSVANNSIVNLVVRGATQENIRLQDAMNTTLIGVDGQGGTYGVRHIDVGATTTGTRLVACRMLDASSQNYAMAVGTFETISCAGLQQDVMLRAGDVDVLRLDYRAGGVNWLRVEPGLVGGGATLAADGADANVSLALYAKGSGVVSLRTGGGTSEVLRARSVADAVHYVTVDNAASGAGPSIGVAGGETDSSAPLLLRSKGGGILSLRTHDGSSEALRVVAVANAVNRLNLSPAITGETVKLQAVGSDTNVSLDLTAQGAGGVRVGASGNALGFFGVAGSTRLPLSAAATDLSTAITLLNEIRSALISYGLNSG